MAFKDLDDFYRIKPKVLPIRGRKYEFPGSVSGRTGLLLVRLGEAVQRSQQNGEEPQPDQSEVELLNDGEEIDLRREILGDGEAEMIRDGIPAAFIQHAFHTLIVWHQTDNEEIAQHIWEDVPGSPKAKPQDRKPKSQRATSGKGGTTKRPVSSTTTSESTPASPGDES